jgi:F0F1-type ATP synthase delta subunit
VAARYARALFDAAVKQKAVEPVRRELAQLRDVLAASPDWTMRSAIRA